MIDLTEKTLGQAATVIARSVKAKKEGQGRADRNGNASRYYRLPSGKRLRVSDHFSPFTYGRGVVDIDLVINPEDGEAFVTINEVSFATAQKELDNISFYLAGPSGPAPDINGDPIPSDLGFDYDEYAWSKAIIDFIKDAAK